MTNDTIDALIREYAAEYTAPVFYFCLRRTGSAAEAEDLAGEIALAVIEGLRRGTVPERFPAWVWQIARNRYSKWAARTHRLSGLYENADVADIDPADDSDLAEELINSEQLSLLRRELAFTAREHRDIIAAYYIEQRKTGEIAKSLGISKGTVVSKLYRIRKKLKEGIEMSREFGKLSYNPEDVGFINNGWGFPEFHRLIEKNILLAAYRTPSTAEELAIELGVALPYMEDELNHLEKLTLLARDGVRYQTNIFIVSARAQKQIYANIQIIASELAQAIIKSREYLVKCYDNNNLRWHEGYQSWEDMKWAALMREVDYITMRVSGRHPLANYPEIGPPVKPNGGSWTIMGLEDYKGDRPDFVGEHGIDELADINLQIYHFSQFKYQYKHIDRQAPLFLKPDDALALVALIRGTELTPFAGQLEKLAEYGYLKKSGERYEPTFWVWLTENKLTLTAEQERQSENLRNAAADLLDAHWKYCEAVIADEIPAHLLDDAYQIKHAVRNILDARGYVLEEALRTGYITYDAHDPGSAKRRMLGAMLQVV
ncbi:MAG: sigma-70 family RNA polymerase sigma factor [Oscillospiraceae bacterium]|jgi:RNA polymerase sigma factor (sigma-70 family)|nr:sigma-70 family RNA polymerase sigma factor [Oscillospiraceae bacterium]